ncbi:MAG: redoxin domain-containing protein [Saccharospirillum sp.]|nr:redoxin domain-containing protein [Saccharospirillum sp.]
MTLGPLTQAPELVISAWYNSKKPIALEQLRGKVVAIYCFQMLCPGCISHSLPQAKKLHQYFSHEDVSILGLHSVFEHHQVMNNQALEAFIGEYRLSFPIAVDKPAVKNPIPETMQRYQLEGTPSLLLIDRYGYLRVEAFGAISDLQVGHWLGSLLSFNPDAFQESSEDNAIGSCNDDGCSIGQ